MARKPTRKPPKGSADDWRAAVAKGESQATPTPTGPTDAVVVLSARVPFRLRKALKDLAGDLTTPTDRVKMEDLLIEAIADFLRKHGRPIE